jgi:hypothetical protein
VRTADGGHAVTTDRPVPPGTDEAGDDAAAAAEQMLAATEKLRAKLPMMQGEGEGTAAASAAPAQPTGV